MTARDVVILGAGKLGILLHDCLAGDDRWRCAGFVDDGKAGEMRGGLPVWGTSDAAPRGVGRAFVAIGDAGLRRRLIDDVAGLDLDWQTYVDRRSVVSEDASLGRGSVVLSFAMVGSGVTTGEHCLFLCYSHASFGTSLGRRTSLMSAAGVGECAVGEDCVLGLRSACVGTSLGDRVVVAPFSFVRRPVPSDSLAAGNPARIVRRGSADEMPPLTRDESVSTV